MLPLVLNPVNIKAGLAGRGPERDRRAALLAEAGVEARLLSDSVPDEVLGSLQLLFVAGLPEGEARDLAGRARALGVLVNVEDRLPLCDFHVPAIVRRGDLLLTASTGGQVPGLARALRESLANSSGRNGRPASRSLAGLAPNCGPMVFPPLRFPSMCAS